MIGCWLLLVRFGWWWLWRCRLWWQCQCRLWQSGFCFVQCSWHGCKRHWEHGMSAQKWWWLSRFFLESCFKFLDFGSQGFTELVNTSKLLTVVLFIIFGLAKKILRGQAERICCLPNFLCGRFAVGFRNGFGCMLNTFQKKCFKSGKRPMSCTVKPRFLHRWDLGQEACKKWGCAKIGGKKRKENRIAVNLAAIINILMDVQSCWL